jgi:hypothetical protein
LSILLTPGWLARVVVELIRYQRLATFIDVNMAHSLFARLMQLGQSFQRSPAVRLRFHGNGA